MASIEHTSDNHWRVYTARRQHCPVKVELNMTTELAKLLVEAETRRLAKINNGRQTEPEDLGSAVMNVLCIYAAQRQIAA